MQRIVLVTGAKGGLGAPVTRAFLRAGDRVAGSSRSIAPREFDGPDFLGIPADLEAAGEAERLAAAVVERWGRIDALVHVTGGFAGGSPIHETEDATWDAMLGINVRAAFHVLRAVIPHMRAQRAGRIVAIGSRAAIATAPGIAAYAASKAALVSLIQTAALENRDAGVTANVLLPGTLDTEANRRGDPQADRSQWIAPERLAELVVLLTSDAAGLVNGAAIAV